MTEFDNETYSYSPSSGRPVTARPLSVACLFWYKPRICTGHAAVRRLKHCFLLHAEERKECLNLSSSRISAISGGFFPDLPWPCSGTVNLTFGRAQ